MRLSLGWECWKTHSDREESDSFRLMALAVLGRGFLNQSGHEQEAVALYEAMVATVRRQWPENRNEILQMLVLEPKLAILDETDSGLDIDALKVVSDGVNALRSPERSVVLVTHYQRLLDHIKPDYVHVLAGGRIVESGGPELALTLEEKGYAWVADKQQASA